MPAERVEKVRTPDCRCGSDRHRILTMTPEDAEMNAQLLSEDRARVAEELAEFDRLIARNDKLRSPWRTWPSTMEDRLRESDRRAASLGLSPLDRSRIVVGCTFEENCSPYMPHDWAHDEHCPRSSGLTGGGST